MPIDFDPLFHTETMVKILREQGSTQYAMELAELILQKNPGHSVGAILGELKEEARRAFERFKSGGKSSEPSDAPAEPNEEMHDEGLAENLSEETRVAQPEAAPQNLEEPVSVLPPRLILVEPPAPLRNARREAKIRRLQALLHRVQQMRRPIDAPQA